MMTINVTLPIIFTTLITQHAFILITVQQVPIGPITRCLTGIDGETKGSEH